MTIVAELADLEPEDATYDSEDTRMGASGLRVGTTAGMIAPVLRHRAARLRTHRLEGSVVAVLLAWAAVGGLTALGWF